ncbi:Rft-1-domain-containing protein [Annulohypoxylon maeteangense]|uniref:Rft-1-domain-containing protein n=1 Tax=Annulohypoxylon maeteangense TaxID=1927788 RepID=UPI002007E657|nr:Rft-1-domain-containing protein [Annulohypoxylon maeteangense]KAI0880657.1 Rft-1-domain-containing protein [Annulohypoxylon maeteangense]
MAKGLGKQPPQANPSPIPPIPPPQASPTTPKQGSAVRGASLLIILQIASRAVTFVANQLLLRFLTAQLLGVSTQLEVYYLSVLFFARESLRVAIQRQDSPSTPTESNANDTKTKTNSADARDNQSVINIAHLSLLLGLGASVGLGWAYLRYVDASTAATPYLDVALRIYSVAAIVELLSEPAFVILQYRLRFGPRAAAESIATFLRCVVTFGAANWAWRQGLEIGVLPFALGQLAYSFGLLAVYMWYGTQLASAEGFSLLLKRSAPLAQKGSKMDEMDANYVLGYFFKPTLQLASSLTAQSFVKHILTQGDTFLVSVLSDPGSQGIYALANNYGGLLARLVFQPVEESSRNYFSKLLSSAKGSPDKQAVNKAKSDLQALLKFYLLLGICVVTVGPFAAPLLIQIVAGAKWSASGAGAVLARYCLYIPLLAINGVAEAFVSSVATESEVHRQSLWMGAFSLAFGVAGFVSLRVLDLGAAGLVYANCINMLCRIVWSGTFISQYFRSNGSDFGWNSVLPDGLALSTLATAVFWASLTRAGFSVGTISTHVFKDLITVAIGAVPFATVIAYTERKYLLSCYHSLRGRSKAVG